MSAIQQILTKKIVAVVRLDDYTRGVDVAQALAAGAVVTGESAQRAAPLGLHAADYLSRNDAYPFFDALGDLLKTGPTGTNVNDLVFLIAL